MILFDYLKKVDYAQGIDLNVLPWRMIVFYKSKEFIPYAVLLYKVVDVQVTEDNKLFISVEVGDPNEY